jgi:hypothetical protein
MTIVGRSWLLVALVLCTGAACGGPRLSAPLARAPEMPTNQARCKVAASRENPLVTEWPASEKANLEALLRQGAVVVAYSGCSLKLLPQCRVRGAYQWRRTTTSTDTLEIRDADELYAKLPIGAVSLEGELQRSGRLAVQTTVAGQLQLADYDPRGMTSGGYCQGATHVVSALSVGAFKLHSGGAGKVGGSAGVAGFGSKGSSSTEQTTMREAGSSERCEQSTDAAPHPECSSPVQMFLQPLPATIADRGPPGFLKVKFLPVHAMEQWDVMAGENQKLCTAPCEKWVDPGVPYVMKYDPGWWTRNKYVSVPDLRPYLSDERVEISVEPTNGGELAGGIVVTTVGGLATAAGTVFLAAGCGRDSKVCAAGGITLPVGLLGLAGGIYLIVDSSGQVKVTPTGEQPVGGR